MKRKIVILAVLTLLVVSTAGVASAQSTGTKSAQSTGTKDVLAFEKTDYTNASVTASILNFREGPSVSYPVISKLQKGQAVRIVGKIGDWYAVYNLNDGTLGAVDGKYLALGDAASPTSANVTQPGAVSDSISTDTNTIAVLDVSQDEQQLLDLVNKARKSAGVEALTFDQNLLKVARLKASDMADNNYFSHQSPTYGSPWDMMRQFDNSFKTAGENIAGNKTVEGAFNAWMASDDHKKNILNDKFSITGIGVASSKTYGKILVEQFIGN